MHANLIPCLEQVDTLLAFTRLHETFCRISCEGCRCESRRWGLTCLAKLISRSVYLDVEVYTDEKQKRGFLPYSIYCKVCM